MNRIWSFVLVLAVFYVAGTRCDSCAGKKMIRKGGLTCADKQVIINEHNRLRQTIALGKVHGQPSAANMVQTVWDDDLAKSAQKWANICCESHDPSRKVGKFSVVGQNLARTWTTKRPTCVADGDPDFVRAIDGWFNEVQKYKPNGHNSGTGHYTQVVWSDTYAVGCGYSFYYDPKLGYTKNYVCNYGPTGNINGYKPYTSGRPACSKYGMSASKSYSGLCIKDNNAPLGAACAASG